MCASWSVRFDALLLLLIHARVVLSADDFYGRKSEPVSILFSCPFFPFFFFILSLSFPILFFSIVSCCFIVFSLSLSLFVEKENGNKNKKKEEILVVSIRGMCIISSRTAAFSRFSATSVYQSPSVSFITHSYLSVSLTHSLSLSLSLSLALSFSIFYFLSLSVYFDGLHDLYLLTSCLLSFIRERNTCNVIV